MAAPHIAGIAALIKQAHPDWSPMAIKSALMTSGSDLLDTFADSATADPAAQDVFADGAGHVQPKEAVDPGLVYDSDVLDWLAFLCGATTGGVDPADCATLKSMGYSLDRSDMNVPSIAIGDLAGVQTVTRRVTNVDDKKATYTASTSMNGVNAVVSPSTLTLAPGETKTFTVAFTVTTAALNKYTGGSLTWTEGKGPKPHHTVRIPIVVRPVAFGADAEASSNGSPVSWNVRTGFVGPLTADVGGLVPATTTPFTVAQDPDQTFVRTDPTGTFSTTVSVPANTVFRTGIYEDAITPTNTDLDLFVYSGSTRVGTSADGDSNEEVTLRTGASPATLTVYIHGFDTGGPSATGTLFTWLVGTANAGNTTLSGVTSPTTIGQQTHTATFTGLAPNTRYLGRVEYSSGTTSLGRTLLSIRTP
jgi:hypothetical protein